ncbi:hypothetical protein MKW98_014289 [Papaver atlanticum]|uniref:Uncharacterized protein n=1 Tax=Papaver atlanticum TaxID=357466 RepID=A0AAD4SYD2_9MAGN|nr:hypothetical protein MKW98_014289 [Papaver atlanticum]
MQECKIESHPSGDVLLGADCNVKEYVNVPSAIVVADELTFVKKCQGKYTLSSTNATKLYLNLDVPELQGMRESWLCTHLGPLRHLHVPVYYKKTCHLGRRRLEDYGIAFSFLERFNCATVMINCCGIQPLTQQIFGSVVTPTNTWLANEIHDSIYASANTVKPIDMAGSIMPVCFVCWASYVLTSKPKVVTRKGRGS